MLEAMGKPLAAASAILLVFSVTFDLAYLRGLGLTLDELPTTISDHVRSAVVWAPWLALFVPVALLAATLPPAMAPVAVRSLGHWGLALASLCLIALIVAAAFVGESIDTDAQSIFALLLVVAVIVGWRLLVADRRLLGGFTPFYLLGAGFLAIVAWYGFAQGTALLAVKDSAATVRIKRGTSEVDIRVAGLRRFPTVAVLVRPEQGLLVLPSDAILQVEYAPGSRQSLACERVGWWCSKPK